MYVIALFLLLQALPESRSGTIIATEFSNERLIIAADSRATNNDGEPISDCECKIHVIAKGLVFAGSGKQHIDYNGRTFLDGTDVAMRVRRNNRNASVQRVATLWAQQMKVGLSEVGTRSRENLLKDLDTETIVHGIFGGVTANGSIAAYNAAVIYELSGEKLILSTRVETLGHGLKVFSDHVDLFQEFFGHNTRRGIDWNTKLDKDLDAKHIIDHAPYRLIAGVEATIKWANDTYIGGDVDGMIIYTGGKITWVKKKDNCAAK